MRAGNCAEPPVRKIRWMSALTDVATKKSSERCTSVTIESQVRSAILLTSRAMVEDDRLDSAPVLNASASSWDTLKWRWISAVSREPPTAMSRVKATAPPERTPTLIELAPTFSRASV